MAVTEGRVPYIYKIPGMGEKSDDICGQVRMALICSKDPSHFNKKVAYSCDSADCPECYEDVIKNDALAVQDHLEAVRLQLRRAGLDPGHPYHFWISPPPELYGQTLAQLRPTAIKFALDLGLIGGYVFDHPYRFQDKHHQMEQYRAGKIDKPYSPHFHIIGFLPYGFPVHKSNVFCAATGWTYGNEGNMNRKKSRPRNIYETAKYELSHVARETWHKHRMFKPFGIMHPSKIKAVVEKCREERLCPRCGAVINKVDPDTGEILGISEIREVTHFELRSDAVPWLKRKWPFLVELFHQVHLDLTDLCRAHVRVDVQGVYYLGVEISSCELPEGAL